MSAEVSASGVTQRLKDEAQQIFIEAVESSSRAGIARLVKKLEMADTARHVARARVVVAGEAKRGKSSLINSLLDRTGLSPVNADVATNAYIEFVFAEHPGVRVLTADALHVSPASTEIETSADELTRWATVEGNPGNAAGVRHIEVRVDAPILRALTLVDTPGVGGLNSAHGEITLQALPLATALLFVVDANAPVSAPELAFLESATECIDTVLFVMTRIDQHPGWRRIMDANRDLIGGRAARYRSAPWFAVSNQIKQEASRLADSDPQFADELDKESGIPLLRRALVPGITDRATLFSLANSARASCHVLDSLDQPLTELARAVGGDPDLRAALEREQQRLKELSREKMEWGPVFANRMHSLRIRCAREVGRSAEDLQHGFDDRINAAPKDRLAIVAQELDAEFAARGAVIIASLAGDLENVARELLGDFLNQAAVGETLQTVAGSTSVVLPPGARPARPRESWRAELMANYQSFSSGSMLPYLLGRIGGAGALGILGGPLAIVPGIALALLSGTIRKGANDRAQLKVWARERLQAGAADLMEQIDLVIADGQLHISRAVREYIQQRDEEIQHTLDVHRRAVVADDGVRNREQRAAGTRLADLRNLRDRAYAVLQAIEELTSSARTGASPDDTAVASSGAVS